MLIVTHNREIRKMMHKVIVLRDGMIAEDYENESRVRAAELTDL